jgi:hypothetical protein
MGKDGGKYGPSSLRGPLFIHSTRKSEKNEVLQIWLGEQKLAHLSEPLLANEFTFAWIKK